MAIRNLATGIAFVLSLVATTAGVVWTQEASRAWLDPATGLMWVTEDNGSNVTWNEANGYCNQLRTGAHRDWHLPSIDQLSALYDPSLTWARHNIKGSINLRDAWVWSATTDGSSRARYFNFADGKVNSHDLNFKSGHALCVRIAAEHVKVLTTRNLDEVLKARVPVLVQFSAEWSTPSRRMDSIVEALATEYADRVVVGRLNIDENPDTAARFQVRGLPTILIFKGGEVVESVVGAPPKEQLEGLLNKHL